MRSRARIDYRSMAEYAALAIRDRSGTACGRSIRDRFGTGRDHHQRRIVGNLRQIERYLGVRSYREGKPQHRAPFAHRGDADADEGYLSSRSSMYRISSSVSLRCPSDPNAPCELELTQLLMHFWVVPNDGSARKPLRQRRGAIAFGTEDRTGESKSKSTSSFDHRPYWHRQLNEMGTSVTSCG